MTCEVCRGIGSIQRGDEQWDDDCAECGGTGKVKPEPDWDAMADDLRERKDLDKERGWPDE